MKRILIVFAVLLTTLASAAGAAPSPARLTVADFPQGIECISFELDGAQLYHQDMKQPIYTEKELRAAVKRFAGELQLRALITHEPRVKSDADRIGAVAEGKGGSYEVGNVCYVLMRYCAPGCTGQWCVTVRVPSIQ